MCDMILLKGSVAHTHNVFAIKECISILPSVYQACILYLDFQLVAITSIDVIPSKNQELCEYCHR